MENRVLLGWVNFNIVISILFIWCILALYINILYFCTFLELLNLYRVSIKIT